MPEIRNIPNGFDVLNQLAGVQAVDEIMLALDDIRLDGGTQPRATISTQTVTQYAEAMMNGDQFPAVEVMYDGQNYWLVDGFHRVNAARLLGKETILAKVRQGTQREAQLASVGVNARHGLPRSADDMRRSVLRMLEDREWGQWSDREIARQCGVSHPTVAKLRRELSGNGLQMEKAESAPVMTVQRRKELIQILSRNANEAMDLMADDMSLTVDELAVMLDIEKQVRNRPAVVKFLSDAIEEESRPAPGEAKPVQAQPVPPQPETRTVQRAGKVYEQKVSSDKRSQAAQARQPMPKPSAAATPALRYEEKPKVGAGWRIRDEQDWLDFSDWMMELLSKDDGSGFEIEVRKA